MASKRNRDSARRIVAGLFSLSLAGLLLYLAVPTAIAAILSLPGNDILARIKKGEAVTTRELEVFLGSRKRALSWVKSAQTYTDLGLGELLLAQRSGQDDSYDQDLLTSAISNLKTGLGRAPARPYAWTRLAYAQLIADGASWEVAQALRMALDTAPYEPRLLLPRLELCLLSWPYLSRTTREATLDQVRIAWQLFPQRLIELARHTNQSNLIRSALVWSLEDLVEFNSRYRAGE